MNSLLDRLRQMVRRVVTVLARGLNRTTGGKLSPHAITLFGLSMHLPIALLIASGDFISAGLLLIVFGLFDTLDGALARVQQRESAAGMLLDSVTDRIKEVLLYTAVAYYFVSVHDAGVAIWAVATCGSALLVSYVNAWGEVVTAGNVPKTQPKNKAFRAGIMSFDIRMATLIIGLLVNQVAIALMVITVLSIVTIIERLFVVLGKLGHAKS